MDNVRFGEVVTRQERSGESVNVREGEGSRRRWASSRRQGEIRAARGLVESWKVAGGGEGLEGHACPVVVMQTRVSGRRDLAGFDSPEGRSGAKMEGTTCARGVLTATGCYVAQWEILDLSETSETIRDIAGDLGGARGPGRYEGMGAWQAGRDGVVDLSIQWHGDEDGV